jgi:phage antirepressor YoqD-like protein
VEFKSGGLLSPPPRTEWWITEAGLYSLVLGSKKPQAQRVKRWVTHEVLPSIRKTGGYGAPQKINVRDATQLAPIALQLIAYTHELKAALAEAQPKVEGYYDKLIDADGLKGLQHAGKALGMRPNKFIELLVANGYLFRRRFDKKLMPYQQYVNLGLFEIKNHVANDRAHMQTFVTQKGFDHFWRKFGGNHLKLN